MASGVLVNCAGTGSSVPLLDLPYEQWRDVLKSMDRSCAPNGPLGTWSALDGADGS